jgi:hypothetical protein
MLHTLRRLLLVSLALVTVWLATGCADVPPASGPYYRDNDHDRYWSPQG